MNNDDKALKELQLRMGVQKLKDSPVNMVKDFQTELVKDLPVEKIDTISRNPLTGIEAFKAKQAALATQQEAKKMALGIVSKGETLDYNQMRKQAAKLGRMKAIAPIAGAVGALVDVKEGNPNTAAARVVAGMAPMGSETLQNDLMQRAELEDKSPYLLDPGYQQTLKNIGARRMKEGRSPVVEAFGGEQIDTSATETSDFMNAVKARMRENKQG